jgi:hypothetical protein
MKNYELRITNEEFPAPTASTKALATAELPAPGKHRALSSEHSVVFSLQSAACSSQETQGIE